MFLSKRYIVQAIRAAQAALCRLQNAPMTDTRMAQWCDSCTGVVYSAPRSLVPSVFCQVPRVECECAAIYRRVARAGGAAVGPLAWMPDTTSATRRRCCSVVTSSDKLAIVLAEGQLKDMTCSHWGWEGQCGAA